MASVCFPHVELKNLGNHLAKLRAATTVFPPAPSSSLQWKTTPALQDALTRLSLCGERVRDTATKFSLVLSSTTSGPGIKSISDEMRQSCDSLLAALAVLVDPAGAAEAGGAAAAAATAGAGAGTPLMELYCQQTRAILRATEDLIKHITSPSSNLLSSPTPRQSSLGVQTELAPKTGVVWEQCDKLGKLPRSNKVAFRRAFLNHFSAVKDTLREFEEMLQEEEEEEEGTEGEEEEEEEEGLVEGVQNMGLAEEEDEEEDFFGGEGGMKEWEKDNVRRCLVALGHCGEMVKGLLDAVDEAMMEGGGEEGRKEGERIQRVAEVEESCQGLAAAVVNAADALYPPQIRQELESQLGALVAAAGHTAAAVARLPSGPAASKCQEEMEKVRAAVALGVAEGTEGEEEEEEEEGLEEGAVGGEASS